MVTSVLFATLKHMLTPGEGTEDKLSTKQKLTPRPATTPPPQPWDVCNIPQALGAALKEKEIVNL